MSVTQRTDTAAARWQPRQIPVNGCSIAVVTWRHQQKDAACSGGAVTVIRESDGWRGTSGWESRVGGHYVPDDDRPGGLAVHRPDPCRSAAICISRSWGGPRLCSEVERAECICGNQPGQGGRYAVDIALNQRQLNQRLAGCLGQAAEIERDCKGFYLPLAAGSGCKREDYRSIRYGVRIQGRTLNQYPEDQRSPCQTINAKPHPAG